MKSCTHPQNGMTISDLPDGEIEIGMGQHGEGGGGRKQLVSANETAEEMIGLLMKKLQPKAGNKALLVINGVGATTHMEMNIVYRKAHQVLENAGIEVAAARIGELLTVQEQAGFQMILGLLDDVLGDGDHGTAIVQSMSALVATADKGTEFKSMLNDMSFNLMLEISGSTSTLLGGFFLGMSDHAEGTELDVAGVKAMFAGGLEGVRKQTKAKQGDKTMMDALIPAVEAIQACDSADVKAILTAGAEAAVKGAEATKDMKANFGRARNYGERSIGYADSGASSWSCMFDAFAKAL